MKTLLATAAIAMTASGSMAAAHAPAKSRPDWMIGKWAWIGASDSIQPGDCPHSEQYQRNGILTDGEVGEVYRWWIEGDYLVRVLVEPMEGEPRSEVGRTYRQRFTRNAAGELTFSGDGWTQKMVRCRTVPTNNR